MSFGRMCAEGINRTRVKLAAGYPYWYGENPNVRAPDPVATTPSSILLGPISALNDNRYPGDVYGPAAFPLEMPESHAPGGFTYQMPQPQAQATQAPPAAAPSPVPAGNWSRAALIGAGALGAAGLGYGAYKMLNKKKKKTEYSERR